MKKLLIASALLIIVLVYFFYPETVISYPAGVMAAEPPQQTNLTSELKWTSEEIYFRSTC